MNLEKNIQISSRFCGPPNSGNGGYVCGRLAEYIEGPVEVMLHKPPPLDKTMQVITQEQGIQLMDGELLIASAHSAVLDLPAPAVPTQAQAIIGSERYYGFHDHPFDTCFVCGPNRRLDDGLRIFAGGYDSEGQVAAPWVPAQDLFGEDGLLMERYIWAALDCPGYAAIAGEEHPVMVLGKFNAETFAPIIPREELIVTGWKLGQERRKHFAGTALFNQLGELKALARAIWIKLQ